jgi:hypothetical protein
MQIIALINQKGGVGKTTCAFNIGAGLNRPNKKGDRGRLVPHPSPPIWKTRRER